MKKVEYFREQFTYYLYKENFDLEPGELYDPVSYILSLGGKRLRPVLLLLACDLFNIDLKKAIYPAIGIEVFHNFTLLHDDIMDNAPIRRGKQTVHKKWNPNIAILSGDTMFALAYQYISEVPVPYLKKALDVFTKTAIEVCEGQQFDMNFENQNNVSIDDYKKMIRLKTAVLIAASLKIGGLIGEASDKDCQNLYRFGEHMGIAFQLMDDLLDVYANKEEFGKTTGGDIVSGKKTFLYLKALELSDIKSKQELLETYNNKTLAEREKVAKVKSIFDGLNIKEITLNEINKYSERSIYFLDLVNADKEKKDVLAGFTKKLMNRTN